MSRLSVPPSPRPPVPADVPRAKSLAPTALANGREPSSSPTAKQAAAAAAKARSPSPEPLKAADDKARGASAEPSSSQPEESDVPVVDMDTFEQILELDEDDEREFSSEMVWQYFEQAEQAFTDMDTNLKEESLSALSSLGHYLKGSSAALGVARVQATCERIQHYGQCWDEEKKAQLSDKAALDKITECLKRGRVEYKEAKAWLQAWYKEKGIVKD